MVLIESPVRVGAGVHFPQRFDVDVRVYLGSFQALMPEHLLNVPDVGPAPVHVGRAGVPEEVAGTWFVDAATSHQSLGPVAQVR